jgi:hypothetical protein
MPVYKYRSVADMPDLPVPAGEDLIRRIRAVWQRANTLFPRTIHRGVQRFRNQEQADAAREAISIMNVQGSK